MKTLTLVGAVLVILGVLGFAVPWFTTTETKDVAKLGDLKVQAQEQKTHSIPPAAAGAVLVVGVVVLGAGLFRRA
jgi:hypothetical protein